MVTSNPPKGSPNSGSQQLNAVSVDGDRQITYAEYGYSDGSPVLFLHGTPGSRRLGELLETAARENDVRVLAPDRPGYGCSSPWPKRSIRDAAEFIIPVLDDANVQTAGIIAFSGGSPFALSIAAMRADRISHVDVIAGVAPPTLSEEPPATQQLLAGLATRTPLLLQGVFRGQTWLAERLDPSFVVGLYTSNDAVVPTAVAEIVKEDFVEAFAHHRSGAVTEFRNTATDWEINFDEINTEVGLWHGNNDTNVPISGVERLEHEIPSAELRVLDDADHLQTLLQSIPHVLGKYQ